MSNLRTAALYFLCMSTFGIVMIVLLLPYDKIGIRSIKRNIYFSAFLAYSLPIISASFIEWNIVRITGFPSMEYKAHTILAHLKDYRDIRFDKGYASALTVINCLTILGLILLVYAIVFSIYRLYSRR